MRKLGLIGGMGPESTVPYYREIVYGVQRAEMRDAIHNQEAPASDSFPELVIESVNLFRVVDLCKDGKFDELVDYLMAAIYNVVKAGAEFVAIASNTPHIVYERLRAQSPVEIISIVEATVHEALKKHFKKVGLLGTIFTMKNDFYKTPFENRGIKVFTPDHVEMEYINDRIYNEIELGSISEETKTGFIEIIERLKRTHDIDAVILGCTELPLFINDEVSPVPCLDTMKIHINSIIHKILS